MRNMQMQRMDWLDRAAMAGSAVCMVHCLALPLILAAVPTVAAIVVVPASFHVWVLVFAVPTAVIALLGGRSRHAVSWPLFIGAAGLGLMTLGAFAIPEGEVETGITVAGGVMVAIAHIANLRLRHSCCA